MYRNKISIFGLFIFSGIFSIAHAEDLGVDQAKVLESMYSGYQVLQSCTVQLSGNSRNEKVVGIVQSHKDPTGIYEDRVKHVVGLIWDGTKWIAHDVYAEILKDDLERQQSPQIWDMSHYDGFAEKFECDMDSSKDPDIRKNDKPPFDRPKVEGKNAQVVCYQTSDVVDNEDCVVFSPKDDRFRLWWQVTNLD